METLTKILDNKSVLAECGPMRLIIQAWQDNTKHPEIALKGAKKSFTYLKQIADIKHILSSYPDKIKIPPDNQIAANMIQSVKGVGDTDLTPMAAVAGAIADATADYLFNHGITKVIIDNGGDIAIRLSENQIASIGVCPNIEDNSMAYKINLCSGSWGVATSGLGGRSLTKGIASGVTIVAKNAAYADAAATCVANACFVEDESTIQAFAEHIDPYTDIAGTKVTVYAGDLSHDKIIQAIDKGFEKAENLCANGLIFGASIAVGNVCAISSYMKKCLQK